MILPLVFAFLIAQVKTQMTKEEREDLLKRTSKPIFEEYIKEQNYDRLEKGKDISFKYNKDKIKEIINEYNFPQNYNFFEDSNAEINVKQQGSCGACWSFASTTALSYRFFKKGINVDLSPQDPLSCLNKDCNDGNFQIPSQLNLLKNGTVTEECLPYTAKNGNVEKCSSSCKDGSEKIKYYSKNAYYIEPIYDEEHYYDYVKVIIDQLINYGPVVGSFKVYEDFFSNKHCPNVYSYDGISEFDSVHSVAIVGYGLYKNKYFWLIQNSWGYGWCDNGFSKIEFGQIESFDFSEPYIMNNSNETKEISVKLVNIVEKAICYINFTLDSYDEDLENNFELVFKNNKNEDKIYYYCGIVPLMNKTSHVCLNDMSKPLLGTYELYNYSSLGKENKFKIINNKFKIRLSEETFITILFSNNKKLYVSEIGSKILLMSFNCDECKFKYNIYPTLYLNRFKECEQINFNNLESKNSYFSKKFYLVSCSIQENEIEYFKYSYKNNSDSKMGFDMTCGRRYYIDAVIYKLDKTKYPLLRIKDFILPSDDYLDIEHSEFKLIADVEGSTSGFTSTNNLFYIFIDIENNDTMKSYELYCKPNDIKIKRNYKIICKFNSNSKKKISYNNVILYPYVHQFDTQPYEVIISKNIIKNKNERNEIESIEDESNEIENIENEKNHDQNNEEENNENIEEENNENEKKHDENIEEENNRNENEKNHDENNEEENNRNESNQNENEKNHDENNEEENNGNENSQNEKKEGESIKPFLKRSSDSRLSRGAITGIIISLLFF